MVFPPPGDESATRGYFREAREILEACNGRYDWKWRELSMGTSHDFAWAIDEGATMIRIGTLVFGERNDKK